jgi:hypothetical protein
MTTKSTYKSSHWWLSFAYPICPACKERGEPSFVGVAIVRAKTEVEALERARELGIHPGLESAHGHSINIEAHPLPDNQLPPRAYRNRLLSRDDLDEMRGEPAGGCSCGEPGCEGKVHLSDHVACASTESIGPTNRYFWLSFADRQNYPNFPFRGVAIVDTEGHENIHPATKAWELGINPGGSVAFQPLSPADLEVFGPYLGKLISNKSEAEQLGKLMS